MIDSILWATGLLVWMAIAVSALLFVPVAMALVVGWPSARIGMALDRRYYDGIEDVQAARTEGHWYYFVTHYTLGIRDRALDFVDWYTRTVLAKTIFAVLP